MSSAEPPVAQSAEATARPAGDRPQATRGLATLSTLLPSLRERPLVEHPDVYQSIHAELQGALADIDNA